MIPDKLYVSHSPCRQKQLNVWFKSIKNTKSIGGKIIMNVYGDSKEETEAIAERVCQLYNDHVDQIRRFIVANKNK